MDLNVLITGQSNAEYFQSDVQQYLASKIEGYLGFDGIYNKVHVVGNGDFTSGTNADGSATEFGSMPLIGFSAYGGKDGNGNAIHKDQPGFVKQQPDGSFANSADGNFVAQAAREDIMSAGTAGDPTTVLWIHNESDTYNGDIQGALATMPLTAAEWTSGVEFEMQQLRSYLGGSAANIKFGLVDSVPFDLGLNIPAQRIKQGFDSVVADPRNGAFVAARISDVDMNDKDRGDTDQYGGTVYGGPHFTLGDDQTLANRSAITIANSFAQYAIAGSPVAVVGTLDGQGPAIVGSLVSATDANTLVVTVALDPKSTGFSTLSTMAAAGVGWSVLDGGNELYANSVTVVGNTTLQVHFAQSIPLDGQSQLYYSYGTGRLAVGADQDSPFSQPAGRETDGPGSGNSGQGNAVYDRNGLPIYGSAYGQAIQNSTYATSMSGVSFTPGPSGEHLSASDGSINNALYVNGSSLVIGGTSVYVDNTSNSGTVARVFVAAVGHEPSTQALDQYNSLVVSGEQTISGVASGLLNEPSSVNNQAGSDNSQFVNLTYENVLGRAANSSEVSSWNQVFAGGTSRANVLINIAQSGEAQLHNLSFDGDTAEATVSNAFKAAFGFQTAPGSSGTQYLVQPLQQGNITARDVGQSLASSGSYQQEMSGKTLSQIIDQVYVNGLERHATQSDINTWTNAFNAGATQGDFLQGVFTSAEEIGLTSSITHQGFVITASYK